MSPNMKMLLVVALTILVSLAFGIGTTGIFYGIAYSVGWEGPQFGPFLIYRSTLAVIAGLGMAIVPPFFAVAAYVVYRLAIKTDHRANNPPA